MKVDMSNRASWALVALLWILSVSESLQQSADLNQVSSEGPTDHDDVDSRRWTTGVWGPWSSWSECSRTCGRGVATQTRVCQQESEYLRIRRMRHSRIHGTNQFAHTKRCLGVFRRFQLCHNKPCEDIVDMRREQCAAYDKKPFHGTLYQWEPFVKDPSRCDLQCRPAGQRFYATLATVVEDGTPCVDPQADDIDDKICVAGQCKAVGCDGVIGSSRLWDKCGVCGGNGTTCRPVTGLFTRPVLPIGYNRLAVLPTGARTIRITELARSRNFLAILAEDGSSVLNGNWSIGRSGDYPGAGTVFTYRRQTETGTTGQVITAPGPISKPLQIMLIYQQRNPGVQYSYSLSTLSQDVEVGAPGAFSKAPKERGQNSTKLPKNPKHRWKNRNKHDKRKPNGVHESSGNRSSALRPAESQQRRGGVDRATISEPFTVYRDVLNDVDAESGGREIHWKLIGFSDCSKSCGGGTRLASAACFSERHKAIVGDQYCHGQPRPPDGQLPCNTEPCSGAWTVGEWSECSTSCGEGKQVRKVTCQGDPRLCTAQAAPPTARPCNLGPCYRWDTSKWGQCSSSCGPGVRRRRVRCVNESGRDPVDSGLCPGPRPADETTCKSTQPCPGSAASQEDGRAQGQPQAQARTQAQPQPQAHARTQSVPQPEWLTTDWNREECQRGSPGDPCQEGEARRGVVCARHGQPVPDAACPASSRPPDVQPCAGTPPTGHGCQGQWFTGQWSKCPEQNCSSAQRRPVLCLSRTSDRVLLSESSCQGSPRPEEERKCPPGICSSSAPTTTHTPWTGLWFVGPWTQCSSSCGSGIESRTVLCQGSEACHARRPESQRPCPGPRPPCPASTSKEDSSCEDKNKNCHLVVQSRLCHYGYYSDICCRSCLLSLT